MKKEKMENTLWITFAVVMSGLLVPSAFGVTEELIYGSSSVELLPVGITPGNPASFEIKFQYTEGPYALDNFVPVIEINPVSAVPHIKIDVKPTGVTQGQIVRVPVTLTVDPQIDHEKVFLSISFTGDHFSSRSDATYKSAWIESAIIDIVQGNTLSLESLVPEPGPVCPAGTTVKNDVCIIAGPYCGEGTTYQDGICVVDKLENPTKTSPDISNCWGGSVCNHDVKSPLKQFKYGLSVDEIQCIGSLILVVKNNDSPACVTLETKTKLIERGWIKYGGDDLPVGINWKKYITVSSIRQNHPGLAEMLPVYEIDDAQDDKMMHKLLVGADGCREETEVCKIPSGVSIDRNYPFLPPDVHISDNDKFTVSLDEIQAERLLSALDWNSNGDSHYSTIQWDKKQYLLILSTSDNVRTPVVKMDLLNASHDPVSLERGMTLKYPVHINTWATYGAPAQIDLFAVQNAKDSGIQVWVDPETIMVPERSNGTSTLFIHASEDAQDGLYDIRVIGKANGNNAGLYCSRTVCPTVSIGDSDWSIRTFGSNTGMGIGSGTAPDNTYLEVELNKKEFFEGDIVEIRAYLVNNGTQNTVLNEPMNLLIKAIRADSSGYYDHFYGIDARNESDNPISIEPNSKALLVRPFYWDQVTFENLEDEQRLEPSSRKMTATFVAGEHTWKDGAWFEIK